MGGKPKSKAVALPKVLYVTIEEMDGQPWFNAHETVDGLDAQRCGRYELVEVGDVVTYQAEFHPQPGKRGRRG